MVFSNEDLEKIEKLASDRIEKFMADRAENGFAQYKKLIEKSLELHEKGIDSLGVSLGNYAATTIEGTAQFAGRAERGLRFDHITLFDTGDFYKSFKVIVRNNNDSFFT